MGQDFRHLVVVEQLMVLDFGFVLDLMRRDKLVELVAYCHRLEAEERQVVLDFDFDLQISNKDIENLIF